MKKFLLFAVLLCASAMLIMDKVSAVTEEKPIIYFKAINPGYTVDGVSNVGELIEIKYEGSEAPYSLAGYSIGYTNSSGKTTTIVEFPENSWIAGSSILLRLASSPDSELADLEYAKTLALKAGPLELIYKEEVIDTVCWTGKDECFASFNSASPTSLVRNEETWEFEHLATYETLYDPAQPSYYEEQVEEIPPPKQCEKLQFSELLSYYESTQSEQFVEFYNPTAEQILLDGCKIKYKNKYYNLTGVVKPEGFFVYLPTEFKLTKSPTNSNKLELIDTDETVADTIEYSSQRKSTAYAFIGYDEKGQEIWRTTYAPTPGEPNNYQEYKTCEEGKVINEETGNCVKKTEVTEVVCGEGKYLNPLTGRCKSYEVEEETTCKEGYYLNPETGRCKKITVNTGADYELKNETYEEKTTFIAIYAVIIIVGVGLIYIGFQYRFEFKRLFKKK